MEIDLLKPLNELRGKDPCGIYKLRIKDKVYIGSSLNIKKRLRHHRRELLKGVHDNKIMQNSFNKYKECFYEIVETLNSNIDNLELRKIEALWIKKIKSNSNLQDHVSGIGGICNKTIFQYNLDGSFIKEWNSAMEASRELNLNYGPIHACANPNVKQSKSAYGFIWSYEYLENINYSNNTGQNLDTVKVYFYKITGEFEKEFESLSDAAHWLSNKINYAKDWKNLRSTIGYALKSPKTRTVRKLYKVLYKKVNNFNDI